MERISYISDSLKSFLSIAEQNLERAPSHDEAALLQCTRGDTLIHAAHFLKSQHFIRS
jgi:hypothetical protein